MANCLRKMTACLALGLALVAVRGVASAAASIIIWFDKEGIKGEVLRHDEEGFEFKLEETGDSVRLRWADLDPLQVKQIQQHLGIDKKREIEQALADEPVGDVIEALKVILKTNRELVGVELRERSTPRELYISTRRIKEIRIPRDTIKSVAKVKVKESLVRSREEMYKGKLASVQPKSAQDHYDMAEYCRAIGYVEKAQEHYDSCQTLDPRYAERIADKMAMLKELAKQQQARDVYVRFQRAKAASDWDDALKMVELLKSYPDFEELTKALAEVPAIEEKRRESLRKKVITAWYTNLDEYLRSFIYGGVSDVPDVPTKIVRTRGNKAFRGILKEETGDEIVLTSEDGNKIWRIPKTEVVSITSAALARGRRSPKFSEARSYVTDTDGGITGDVATKIATVFKITEDEAKEMWKSRLKKTYIVSATGVASNKLFYSYRDANYGKGSWLRDGAQAAVQVAQAGGGGRTGGRSTRGGGGRTGGNQQPTGDASTDPEEWWKVQPRETRVAVMRAMCYEALLEVTQVMESKCGSCGGKGAIWGRDTTGQQTMQLCPRCHGVRIDYKIRGR